MQEEHVCRNGSRVAGFDVGVGAHWSPGWREPGMKLAAMERLIAEGRGDELVEGGGCTEPGGGIVPTQRTAREMAALLRGQMRSREQAGLRDASDQAAFRDAPDQVGLGHLDSPAPPHPSPWKYALVMSVVGTATGWVLEEIARRTFRKKRRSR